MLAVRNRIQRVSRADHQAAIGPHFNEGENYVSEKVRLLLVDTCDVPRRHVADYSLVARFSGL